MIISVVTPTLNAMEFLEQALQSVQAQAAPGLEVEHVVVDGGSTDGTQDLARQYGATLLEGKDDGIFDAINKGSLRSHGELVGFLGADDLLEHGALPEVARRYLRHKRPWLSGGLRFIDKAGNDRGVVSAPPAWMTAGMYAAYGWPPVAHPATYIARDFFERLGGLDLAFNVAADYDLFCRARLISPYTRVPRPIASFRVTGQNYSAVNIKVARENRLAIRQRYGPSSSIQRQLYNVTVRTWLLTANPVWAYREWLPSIPPARAVSKWQSRLRGARKGSDQS